MNALFLILHLLAADELLNVVFYLDFQVSQDNHIALVHALHNFFSSSRAHDKEELIGPVFLHEYCQAGAAGQFAFLLLAQLLN